MKENRGGLLETTRRIEQWPIVRLSTVSRPGGESGPANNSISTLLEEENLRWRFILPPSSPFFFHGHVKCISIFSPLPIEFFIEHALYLSLSLSLSLWIHPLAASLRLSIESVSFRRKEERKKRKQRRNREREKKKIKEWKEKISRR